MVKFLGKEAPPQSLVVWYAICLHLVFGLALLNNPQAAAGVTSLATVLYFIPLPEGTYTIILVALLALWAKFLDEVRPSRILLLFPQQLVLMLSAAGAIVAILTGRFADGVERPFEFLLADQAPAILTAIFHTVAIIRLAVYYFRAARRQGLSPIRDILSTKLVVTEDNNNHG